MVIKHTWKNYRRVCSDAPVSGILAYVYNGSYPILTEWIRTERAVESEKEAFFPTKSAKNGELPLWKGADMGILVPEVA